MPGLPKIVLARLKANAVAPKSSGAPVVPDGFQGADHPDANLLAAFVEKTLTETERTQVLSHLSQCAECREIAAFTLPARDAAAEPAPVTVGRRGSPWLVLRWGAMAAVLGALAFVVVLHPGMWNGHPEILPATRPPAPAGNITSPPQSVSARPIAQPPTETSQAKAPAEVRKSVGDLAAAGNALETHQGLARDAQLARRQAKQQVASVASSRPSATFRTENVPALNAEREESAESKKVGNAVTAEALPTPPAPSVPGAPTGATAAAPEEATKPGAEPEAGPATMHAVTQSVEVTATGGGGFGGGGEGGRGGGGGAAAAKAAPRVAVPDAVRMTAQAPMVALRASHKNAALDAGPPATLWSVSSEGKVQRSTDGGKTFEQIQVAHGGKLRAIAALGNEVWTGGAGGALFHSTDGGATWNRTGIQFEGNTITETIFAIQIHGPQHLTVTTASGAQWVSEDGGQNWQKKP